MKIYLTYEELNRLCLTDADITPGDIQAFAEALAAFIGVAAVVVTDLTKVDGILEAVVDTEIPEDTVLAAMAVVEGTAHYPEGGLTSQDEGSEQQQIEMWPR